MAFIGGRLNSSFVVSRDFSSQFGCFGSLANREAYEEPVRRGADFEWAGEELLQPLSTTSLNVP